MGNSSQKLAEKCSLLNKNEIPIVASSFKLVSKNSERIKEDELKKFWGTQMDPRLSQYITNFLFGPLGNRNPVVEFQRFAELYVYCVRGTIDERITVLMASLGQEDQETSEIAYPLIKEYVEAVVSSYMRALRLESGPQYKSWETRGFRIVKDCVQKLAESLAYDVVTQGTQKVTRADAERWLHKNPVFLRMLEHVFLHLYHYRAVKNPNDEKREKEDGGSGQGSGKVKAFCLEDSLLPTCENIHYMPDYPTFIDISQIIFINSQLPKEYQSKWRFLFSSQIHGESFSTFIGRIMDQGATVIIIEDTNGYIFGGFATDSWALSPNFVGNDNSFLFTLRQRMRCFPATTYNDHYQYLNLHQQTMPNGLGMGGQFNYWGLWLDSEYGNGECSESCTTYKNYIQLAATKSFKIRNVEVWGVGDKPVKEDEDEGMSGSCIDREYEAKAMLKIAGREMHSEGVIRDDPMTEHEKF